MNIVIISGSVRTGRQSHKIAVELQHAFMKTGYLQTEVLDLANYHLPVLEERYNAKVDNQPEGLKEMQQQLDSADAIIFLSPEYHGSYSGALKNAVAYFWKEFMRKPIGVVSVSTGKFGGINASTEMQHLVLSLGGFAMPHKLLIPAVHQAFNESNELSDVNVVNSIGRFVTEFTWFAEAIVGKKESDKRKTAIA